jgi:amidohydrolase
MTAIIDTFKHEARDLYPQLVAWRRNFHMHPELGFQELRTAGIVAEHLHNLGLEVSSGVGKTGVVALVEGDDLPVDAPTVMLRFDMDALPIQEVSDAPYRSQQPGVMHACGHDGHTAIGMGVAALLTKHRAALPGRVKLVFQPAEEGLGGAMAMIGDGVLESPTPAAAFGLHLWSRHPLDNVVVQSGPVFAAADKIDLVVIGQSGHGAVPQETVDATLVASQIVVAWQSIVARNVSPTDTAVITVGAFHSGNASNVISGRAELSCSIRALLPDVRSQLIRRMEEMAHGICAAYGATCQLTVAGGVPPTVNSEEGAAIMRAVATQVVGADKVTQMTPLMVSEDMSEFLNRAPGCYVLVGASDPAGPLHSAHHNDTFDFDERMMPTGVALLAGAAVTYLAAAK